MYTVYCIYTCMQVLLTCADTRKASCFSCFLFAFSSILCLSYTEASFGGGWGAVAPPSPKEEEKKKKRKKKEKKEKKGKKERKKEGNYMNNVKLLHIKCCFFQFFNSPVTLKNLKKFGPPQEKVEMTPLILYFV